MDFDTFLVQDPRSVVFLNSKADLSLGGSITDDCINTGLVYLKYYAESTKKTKNIQLLSFLQLVLGYLYDNPFAIDQKVISNFIKSLQGST